MTELQLDHVLNDVVDWRFKGFPSTPQPITVAQVGEQGWHALDGDLLLPLLLIKETSLDHNIRLMARYCRDHGVALAPHGKTPIAPQIVERQLQAGAWGVTAANIHQARVFRAAGVRRIVLANELLEREGLCWVAAEADGDSDFQFLFVADSPAAVALAHRALEAIRPRRPLQVLAEIGVSGGRTGARGVEAGLEVARAITGSPHLTLAGVEAYEGAVSGPGGGERVAAVDAYLCDVRALAERLSAEGLFGGLDEIIVSAGGSLYFDRVVDVLGSDWNLSAPVRVLLRSGSYFAHDIDSYRLLSPLAERGGAAEQLRPALEAWGMVLSRPEEDRAIVGFGKRDVPYDLALPIPFAWRRNGVTSHLSGATVTVLNDQHAFVQVDSSCDLAVGDVIGCGISHPCTAFDKWHLLPLVDDDYRVVGAIRTYF